MASFLKRNVVWLALFVGLTLSGSAWADPVLKEAHLPPDIYEGQSTQLKLTFEWPAREGAYEIKAPQDISLDNIKLLDVGQSQETYSSNSGPISRLVLTCKIQPLKTGRGTINSFNVLARKQNSTSWKKIPVPAVFMDIKPAFPVKMILILLSIMAAIIIPSAIWFLQALRIERKNEEIIEKDPKQQLYVDAAKSFNTYVTGYNASSLRTLLTDWFITLTRVVMVCYDIPVRPVTKSEILGDLRARNIPAGEIHVIEGLLSSFEHLKFSSKGITDNEVEKIRLSLLQYAKGKIIIGNPNF